MLGGVACRPSERIQEATRRATQKAPEYRLDGPLYNRAEKEVVSQFDCGGVVHWYLDWSGAYWRMNIRVEVKQAARGQWVWELYYGTDTVWLQRSASFFATPDEAATDGALALARIEQPDSVKWGI